MKSCRHLGAQPCISHRQVQHRQPWITEHASAACDRVCAHIITVFRGDYQLENLTCVTACCIDVTACFGAQKFSRKEGLRESPVSIRICELTRNIFCAANAAAQKSRSGVIIPGSAYEENELSLRVMKPENHPPAW